MLNNSAMADGTVLIKVTSWRAGKPGNCRALSARITVPPQLNGTNNSNTDKSKQIDVDARTPANSSRVKILFAQWMKATVLRCSMATPFGLPVEPDV